MSDHRAEVRPSTRTWRVSYGGRVLLESAEVVELDESYGDRRFPTRYYFSPAAVAGLELTRTDRQTFCPLKGDAAYFTVAGIDGVEDGVWSYPTAFEGVAPIAGFFGFDQDRGFVIEAVPGTHTATTKERDMSMYPTIVPQLLKMLTNLEGWLTKAEAFAAERDIAEETLLQQRLFPNMYTLTGQVQFACSNAALLVARLGDAPPPAAKPIEPTLASVREHIAHTRGFIEGVDPAGFEGAEQRHVSIPLIDGMVIRGHDMARDFSMPNVYFHLTTAYGILRALGVDLGKADFLGPMALMPASAV